MNYDANCKNCKALMEQIRALDFAIVETALYLNAYPENCEALAYYHELTDKREVLAHSYEQHCGPLTIGGNKSVNTWDWTHGPWPWECDAN